MLKTKLSQVKIREYSECLIGNTLILHSGLKIFKRKIQDKCNDAFEDITNELNSQMSANGGNIIYRSWSKMMRLHCRCRGLIIGYQALTLGKFDNIITELKDLGFTYNDAVSHVDNLRSLSAMIDRLQSQLRGTSKQHDEIINDAKKADGVSLDEVIIGINRGLGYSQLTTESYLSEMVAALKAVNKKPTAKVKK